MIKQNIEVMYGLFCGVALLLWVLIEFFLGFHSTSFEIGRYTGYFSIFIPIVFIFVALRERQTQTNGVLAFKDGVNIGFRIAFISSVVFTIFLLFYNNYINPNWIEQMVEWQRKNLIINGATNDEIGRFVEQNRYQNSIPAQTLMNLISSTGIGVFITLIEIPIIKKFFTMK